MVDIKDWNGHPLYHVDTLFFQLFIHASNAAAGVAGH